MVFFRKTLRLWSKVGISSSSRHLYRSWPVFKSDFVIQNVLCTVDNCTCWAFSFYFTIYFFKMSIRSIFIYIGILFSFFLFESTVISKLAIYVFKFFVEKKGLQIIKYFNKLPPPLKIPISVKKKITLTSVIFRTRNNLWPMLLILDGNSKIGAHVRSNLCFLSV